MIHRARTHLASLAALATLALAGCGDAAPERLTAPAERASLTSSATSVSLSGPVTAYDDTVNLTATPDPAGTYHYTWKTKRCTAGGTCATTYSLATQGTNLTSYTDFVSRHDVNLVVRVELRDSAGGPLLASYPHVISGEGEPGGPGGCTPQLFC